MRQKIVSVSEMKRLDRRAISHFGIPSLILMENAGRGVAEFVRKKIEKNNGVLILCGKGNNGGDGMVAARHLFNAGVPVKVILLTKPEALKGDAELNFKILKKMKAPVLSLRTLPPLKRELQKADFVIDAIFGVGLKREISGFLKGVIESAHLARKPVFSIDLPSGLDGDSGAVLGACIRAKWTLTLGCAKRGLYCRNGPQMAGRIVVLDISLPKGI